MKKKEFLSELEAHLIGVPKDDKLEIMQDYKEHFKIGKKDKRSESEISRSLGDPKIIARDIRRELSKGEDLKSEAIETWVATKKFARHLFTELRDKTNKLIKKEEENYKKGRFTSEHWIALGLILLTIIMGAPFFFLLLFCLAIYSIIKYSNKNDKGKKSNRQVAPKKTIKNDNSKRSSIRILLVLLFNLLFFIWIWAGSLAGLIALFIASLAVIIAGSLSIAYSIFAIISYDTVLTKDIIFSGLFFAIGITLMGGLILSLFDFMIRLFLKGTKKYFELNMEFVKK